jgi:hypothetical protein
VNSPCSNVSAGYLKKNLKSPPMVPLRAILLEAVPVPTDSLDHLCRSSFVRPGLAAGRRSDYTSYDLHF